jgi:hypothetical protein
MVIGLYIQQITQHFVEMCLWMAIYRNFYARNFLFCYITQWIGVLAIYARIFFLLMGGRPDQFKYINNIYVYYGMKVIYWSNNLPDDLCGISRLYNKL